MKKQNMFKLFLSLSGLSIGSLALVSCSSNTLGPHNNDKKVNASPLTVLIPSKPSKPNKISAQDAFKKSNYFLPLKDWFFKDQTDNLWTFPKLEATRIVDKKINVNGKNIEIVTSIIKGQANHTNHIWGLRYYASFNINDQLYIFSE